MRPSTVLSFLAFSALSLLTSAADVQIETLHEVDPCERRTKEGDTVQMHYRGTLESDGSEFDASYKRNQPLKFKIGAGTVIAGWERGLVDMCVGEKRKLTVPPELGYGDRGIGPIPGGATLVFETELVEIEGAPKGEL